MEQRTLDETLRDIADYTGLDISTLSKEAHLDQIGGYHSDPNKRAFASGSIWGVEGQVLYGLVRALRPLRVLELGTCSGCSTNHIAAALEANREDYGDDVQMVTVDDGATDASPKLSHDFIKVVTMDAIDYLQGYAGRFDLLFEDSKHQSDFVRDVYVNALRLANSGAVLISHDVAHYIVGDAMRYGMSEAGITPLVTLTHPADCGLSFFRVPESESVDFEEQQVELHDEIELMGGDDPTERMPVFDPLTFEDEVETNPQPVYTMPDNEPYQYTFDDLAAMTKTELLHELEALTVDPNTIEGSGAGGNILKSDLIAALMTALKPQ